MIFYKLFMLSSFEVHRKASKRVQGSNIPLTCSPCSYCLTESLCSGGAQGMDVAAAPRAVGAHVCVCVCACARRRVGTCAWVCRVREVTGKQTSGA